MKALRFVLASWAVSLVATVAAFGQPPDSLWSRTCGGNGDDVCSSVQQTSDGGYILAGTDVIRTDSDGEILWTGLSEQHPFVGRYESVQQTSDNGYILVGWSEWVWHAMYYAGEIAKSDSNGDVEWWHSCQEGILFDSRAFFYCVQQDSDGSFISGGTAYPVNWPYSNDFWLMKTNAVGDCVWTRTYGGSAYDECRAVQKASDGGYILAGWTESFGAGEADFWLLKTNENGDSLWSRT